MANIFQLQHPRTKRWIKVNKDKGTLTCKKSPGPYKNIPIISNEKNQINQN